LNLRVWNLGLGKFTTRVPFLPIFLFVPFLPVPFLPVPFLLNTVASI